MADNAGNTVKLPSFIPEFDGLRGLAISAVFLFHTRLFIPGFLGVNLFFMLSGFLITGILLDTKGRPDYFVRFYNRRILRIFPIYFAVIFATIIIGRFLEWHMEDIIWYVVYL